jgi:peptide chain release factor
METPVKPHCQFWLLLSSGQGPVECGWAVAEILRRLEHGAAAAGLSFDLLECVPHPGGHGASTVLVRVEGGEEATPFVRSWTGTVLWIGKSPFRPEHKRKNWFVSVESIDAADGESDSPLLDKASLRWETMRASGPGGQHVNRTESAVRLTHLPTGIQVTASEERSQHRNRRLALARLARRLEENSRRLAEAAEKRRWESAHSLVRGNPVRTFRAE